MNKNLSDWRWQIKNSITSFAELEKHLGCMINNTDKPDWPKLLGLPFAITPYYVSLMDGTPECPIFSQLVPRAQELTKEPILMRDPLGEEEREAVPNLIHRYPDRVLIFPTDRCAAYCRFCFRKRLVGQGPTPSREDHDLAFKYIEKNPNIREIIFTGGDPLMLSNNRLFELLDRASSISHIEFIRLHSRMLTFAPMRIDDEFACGVKKYPSLYFLTHFNHPREITSEAQIAIKKLQDSGVLVLNQTVLLRDINDKPEILIELFRKLVKLKTRPYYLHQCDLVEGTSHFRVPIKQALNIMAQLRGHISGLCMPTFVIDIPGGHGKVPLVPNPIIREDEDFIYLQGFNGGVQAYPKN